MNAFLNRRLALNDIVCGVFIRLGEKILNVSTTKLITTVFRLSLLDIKEDILFNDKIVGPIFMLFSLISFYCYKV